VFNIFAILGLTAVIPIPVPPGLTPVDLAFFAGSALILVAFLVIGRIGRGAGLGMLALTLPISAGSRSGLPDFRAKHRRRADRMPRPLRGHGSVLPSAASKGDPMPDHIKLILRHAFFGFLIALAFVAGLLALNVANLWHLVTHTAKRGRSPVLMLVVFCTITFGSVQIGYKIMSMGEEDDEPRGGKRDAVRVFDAIPVPVRVEERRR
jgi:hypothetical protein